MWYACGIYVVVAALTRAVSQGDTPSYVNSILGYSGGRDFAFWDFGHILWRALLWALLHAIRLPRINSERLLLDLAFAINWIAGLGCVLLAASIALRYVRPLVAVLAASSLIVAQAFLNYLHTGTAYVPGLFFLFLALQLLTSDSQLALVLWRRAAMVGVCLAAAVLLWLPYVFALPGFFLFPLLMGGVSGASLRYTTKSIGACACLGLAVYGAVAVGMHLASLRDVLAWYEQASHGIDHIGGLPRAAFGFTRSWFAMGADGIKFKRFLSRDPYAPVSFASLLFSGLWKIALTYLCLAAISFRLLLGSVQQRRVLAFLALVFIPVFAFGVKWQGGDMERYLPIFPALLLSGVYAISKRPRLICSICVGVFLCAVALINLPRYAFWVREAEDQALSVRLEALGSIPNGSYVVVFPEDPLRGVAAKGSSSASGESGNLLVAPVVGVGYDNALQWRSQFARESLDEWRVGGQVWICRGLLDAIPDEKWGWVEGAESGVHWADVRIFFGSLQKGETRGEFVLVPQTEANLTFLSTLSR